MIKKILIIIIMVIIFLCAGCMTTYDITHAATIKTGITKTTTTKSNYKKPCKKSCSIKKVRKSVTKASKKAVIKFNCPCCGNGLSSECVYYIHNEKRHMTETEIKEFEWLEWHYLAEDGNWYEVRTGNTEPVEKPDYVEEW